MVLRQGWGGILGVGGMRGVVDIWGFHFCAVVLVAALGSPVLALGSRAQRPSRTRVWGVGAALRCGTGTPSWSQSEFRLGKGPISILALGAARMLVLGRGDGCKGLILWCPTRCHPSGNTGPRVGLSPCSWRTDRRHLTSCRHQLSSGRMLFHLRVCALLNVLRPGRQRGRFVQRMYICLRRFRVLWDRLFPVQTGPSLGSSP